MMHHLLSDSQSSVRENVETRIHRFTSTRTHARLRALKSTHYTLEQTHTHTEQGEWA